MQVEVTHLFSTTKCIQTGHPYRLSVAQKKNRLGLTDSLSTSNGKTRNEAWHEWRFFARTRVSLLFTQQDAESK